MPALRVTNHRWPREAARVLFTLGACATLSACAGGISAEDPGEAAPPAGTGRAGQPAGTPPGAPLAPPTPGSGASPPSTPPTPGTPGRPATCAGAGKPGTLILRRLTNGEYERSVRDLIAGRKGAVTGDFPRDSVVDGFENNAEALVLSATHAEKYRDAAEKIASEAMALARSPGSTFLGCDLAADRAGCLRGFTSKFGRRAFRRPLAEAELGELLKVADVAAADPDPFMPIGLVIQAVLQSPNFLFRVESGAKNATDPQRPGQLKLTGYEVAARLSYLLLGTTPPDALLDAAAQGQLDTAEGVVARARELLKDTRAKESIRAFFQQWVRLEDLPTTRVDTKVNPTWTEGIRSSLLEETRKFMDDVLWNGSVLDMLDGRSSFLDANLAKHYGVTLPAGSMGFVKTTFTTEPRAGLLTQGSFLTVHGREEGLAPIVRGKFVRESLLCEPPPPPPDNVPPLPEQKGTESVRARLEAHRTNPACTACHAAIDPIGLGLEQYDLTGRFRVKDAGGNALTGKGRVEGLDKPDYTGGVELAGKLRGAAQFPGCFATQVFRYGFGRDAGVGDACALDAVTAAFKQQDHALPALLLALVGSDSFRYASEEAAR